MTVTAADIARDIVQEMKDRPGLFDVGCSCCGLSTDEVIVSQQGIDFLERSIREAVKKLTHLQPVDDFKSIGELVKDIPAQTREAMGAR